MIKAGIPHSLRPHIWMRISGALEKKNKSLTSYKEIVKASSNDLLMTSKQIEKVIGFVSAGRVYSYIYAITNGFGVSNNLMFISHSSPV